jgi:hypothetical protein
MEELNALTALTPAVRVVVDAEFRVKRHAADVRRVGRDVPRLPCGGHAGNHATAKGRPPGART